MASDAHCLAPIDPGIDCESILAAGTPSMKPTPARRDRHGAGEIRLLLRKGYRGARADPCRVTVETTAGKWQVWTCHGNCFRARLFEHTDHPGLFEPAHF